MSNNPTPLEQILIYDEELKLKPYLDSLGYWTYGIGRFIGTELSNLKISTNIAMAMLEEDINTAIRGALKIFGELSLKNWEAARRDAILSLLFNMGESRFLGFQKMIAAIKEERWNDAGDELRNSLWANQVDPQHRIGKGRDDRLIYMLQTGKYHEEYDIDFSALDV